jgi:hypothetical protein
MPLIKSGSKQAISTNISEMVHAGHPQRQAVAAALSTARRYGKKAYGGPIETKGGVEGAKRFMSSLSNISSQGYEQRMKQQGEEASDISDAVPRGKAFGGPNIESMIMRGSSYGMRREGMINSSVPGRTDKLPMNVRSGSYVLPADIPSALGQGNSQAGGQILQKMFSSGPYGLPLPKGGGRPNMPKLGLKPQSPIMPKFAEGGETDSHVPIIAAGGEYLIHPDVVKDIGHGSISAGHRVLDKFVVNTRKKYAETLKKLPGPKR